MTSKITPIPSPPFLPLIGNAAQFDQETPVRTLTAFADKYGEIYRLYFPGRTSVIVCSYRLVDELCDEKRFVKVPNGPLAEIRNGIHDGLFTANPDEEAWGIAHRVLMPAYNPHGDSILTLHRFGPLSIRGMFAEMHDISSQMLLKFARYGPDTPIHVSDDFTRLALDTLGLCSMGFRFNSFYTKELHPFIEAMGAFLTESGRRANKVLPTYFYRSEEAKYWADINILRTTAQEVLKARKANPSDRKDLLNAMLKGRDPKTGKMMTDDSIIDNLITFLIAGHETTSGTLSFAFYRMLKNPDTYQKAQKEVDEVVGKGPITVDHLSRLPYVTAVIRETLRFDSPITAYGVISQEDQLLGGQYPVNKNEHCLFFLTRMHFDPAVWGDDSYEFKPERMLDEHFNKLPKNAWKPFGNGARACIGRPFAMQEAILAVAMLLQNFNFVMHDPTYNLAIKQTLTLKPNNFYMRAILRHGMTPTQLEHHLAGQNVSQDDSKKPSEGTLTPESGKKLTVLYGSNSGTCEALAQRLANDASNHGFTIDKVDCLDAANGALPKNQPVVIITGSYEGEAPDNAALFVSWLSGVEEKTLLQGVDYTVYGLGHHDWAQTFHRIPKLVDSKLEAAGATRIAELGLSDAGSTDTFTDFETWEDNVLWPALQKKYGAADGHENKESATLSVEITSPRTSTLRQDVMEAFVVGTKTLTAPGEPVKKSIEIALPTGHTYRSGDYLAVLPINPKNAVQRAMRRFHLVWDAHITIADAANTSLPTGSSMPVHSLLSAYVELAQPATKRNIKVIAEVATDAADKAALEKYVEADYTEIVNKRISILDLLEKFPAVDLPLGTFLAMLPPMRVRQYSISSSPLWNACHVTLTFGVLEAPSKSGQGTYNGVASSYLDTLEAGDRLHVAVRPSHAAFHLPQIPETTPVICIGAGTGMGPFRGFIQERAEMINAGRKLAPALLLFGCRGPTRDDLYAEELAEWEKVGAVVVKRAYSRDTDKSDGGKYVQELISSQKDVILPLWDKGARLYICGSRAIGEGVKEEVMKLVTGLQMEKGEETDPDRLKKWWEGLRNVRYATDVFD